MILLSQGIKTQNPLKEIRPKNKNRIFNLKQNKPKFFCKSRLKFSKYINTLLNPKPTERQKLFYSSIFSRIRLLSNLKDNKVSNLTGKKGLNRLIFPCELNLLGIFESLSITNNCIMTPACVLDALNLNITANILSKLNDSRRSPDLGDESGTDERSVGLEGDLLEPEISMEEKVESSLKDSETNESEGIFTRRWYYPHVKSDSTPERDCKSAAEGEFDFASFKVMTFNTLAQSLVDDKYRGNDETTMSWENRKLEILRVIEESGCDVVCLQEIDEADYFDFFRPKTEELGYNSVYKKKLQNRLDGILTLYKRDRYDLVLKSELNFSSRHEEYNKPQVALILGLRDLYTRRPKPGEGLSSCDKKLEDILLVTNTHLMFNKSRGDVKLYQLCKLLSGVKQAYETLITRTEHLFRFNSPERILPNVLICGDFNITPQSLAYNYLFKGFAPLKNTRVRFISGQYLMFDNVYLTSSSGHNESGETLGTVKHYISDVYNENGTKGDSFHSDMTRVNSGIQDVNSDTPTCHDDSRVLESSIGYENSYVLGTNWYGPILREFEEDFRVRPKFVSQDQVNEFLKLLHLQGSDKGEDLELEFATKLNLSGEKMAKEYDVIYCPLKLSSAYSVDDGFNCEPAFTAFHGWQRGCVDYICYDNDQTMLTGIYEMPLYSQVKQYGDLPNKVREHLYCFLEMALLGSL